MKRTLWKWAAPAVVLATVAVWGWAQESKPPVPRGSAAGLPAAGGAGAPYNPGAPGGPSDPREAERGVPFLLPRNAASDRVVDVVDSKGNPYRMYVSKSAMIGSTLFVDDVSGNRVTYTVVADLDAPVPGVSPFGSDGAVGMSGGGYPGGAAGAALPGMTSPGGFSRIVVGDARMSGPPVAYRPVISRRTVLESKMVPLTAEEVLEAKQFQDLQQQLGDATKTDAEKELVHKQLGELLEKQFNRDFETREKDVVELETRVKKLREQLDKRKAAKEKIIELRQMTILNSLDGLGFPGEGGMVTPPIGFEAPSLAPGRYYNPEPDSGLSDPT